MEPVFSPSFPVKRCWRPPRSSILPGVSSSWSRKGASRWSTGEPGTWQIGGAADRRRAALGYARRHGRCDRETSVKKHRLLSRAGRHLRGEAGTVQPLGWLQSSARSAGERTWLPHGSDLCSWSTKPRRSALTSSVSCGIFSSADFDAKSLLTVILSGDGRLLELLRHDDLVPLGTRIRTRLVPSPPRARSFWNCFSTRFRRPAMLR